MTLIDPKQDRHESPAQSAGQPRKPHASATGRSTASDPLDEDAAYDKETDAHDSSPRLSRGSVCSALFNAAASFHGNAFLAN